jgi:hypothetical protein
MAETIKGRKLTLREILDQIADDEEFSPEERELARDKSKELESRDGLRHDRIKLCQKMPQDKL